MMPDCFVMSDTDTFVYVLPRAKQVPGFEDPSPGGGEANWYQMVSPAVGTPFPNVIGAVETSYAT